MEIKQSKQKLDMIFIIGMSVGESISDSLRAFYNTIKHYNLHSGDGIFNYYKHLEGKFFQDESKFILHNKARNNQDFVNVAVNNREIREFQKLCKDYGIDILYMKRPDNLSDLLKMDQQGVELTNNQRNILNAFTVKNGKGDVYLKEDAGLVCFSARDIEIMERVLDRLEEKTLSIQKRKERAEEILAKIKKPVLSKKIDQGKEL